MLRRERDGLYLAYCLQTSASVLVSWPFLAAAAEYIELGYVQQATFASYWKRSLAHLGVVE